jgi:hypothetical protein
MNDRQRLEAIVDVVVRYLPPHGIPIKDAMSEIIELVDPLPDLPKQEMREWVGLTDDEILDALGALEAEEAVFRVARAVESKLKERNA